MMARLFSLALLVVALGTQVQAGVLTNGALTVCLRSNGTINSAVFNGVNFFKPGVGNDVSNFGIQNGSYKNTFLINRTGGLTGLSLTEAGYNYHGTKSWSSAAGLGFQRSYSLVDGLNALRVTTTLTNIGSGDITGSLFDSFDPDQAYGFAPDLTSQTPALAPFETYNDVFALSGGVVGQASINTGGRKLTVLVGSMDSRTTVASGGPLEIGSGKELNNFFANITDDNGILADRGTHIGLRQLLAPNQSTTFTYILAFGENPTDAQRAFTLASVPEPSSVAVFGVLGLCGLFLRRRAKR